MSNENNAQRESLSRENLDLDHYVFSLPHNIHLQYSLGQINGPKIADDIVKVVMEHNNLRPKVAALVNNMLHNFYNSGSHQLNVEVYTKTRRDDALVTLTLAPHGLIAGEQNDRQEYCNGRLAQEILKRAGLSPRIELELKGNDTTFSLGEHFNFVHSGKFGGQTVRQETTTVGPENILANYNPEHLYQAILFALIERARSYNTSHWKHVLLHLDSRQSHQVALSEFMQLALDMIRERMK